MSMTRFRSNLIKALSVALAISLVAVQHAEARRGGSFGSRGSRTYSMPRSTPTTPNYVAPVQRSMTSPTTAAPYGGRYGAPYSPGPSIPAPAPVGPRFGGFGGGFGGGFLGGLVTGGVLGGLLGHGFGGGYGGGWGGGGGAGFLGGMLQLVILGFVVLMALRLFRRRSSMERGPWEEPAYGGPTGYGAPGYGARGQGVPGQGVPGQGAAGQSSGSCGGPPPSGAPYAPTGDPAVEFALTQQDRDAFERLLTEVQDAFGREDYGALRERTTPEVMSYLAEELSDNATHGRRNEVTGTRLLQADIAEAWRETNLEYATAALHYESIDVMRDRASGAVLSGDPDRPSQATELWTFVRQADGPWKLSAIQEA
jgi:predicted lipid-binding transport protein (Tim44 family)